MRDDAERAKLHVDLRERNHALLNRQPEQAATKRRQQAGAGAYHNDATWLRMAHARRSCCKRTIDYRAGYVRLHFSLGCFCCGFAEIVCNSKLHNFADQVERDWRIEREFHGALT